MIELSLNNSLYSGVFSERLLGNYFLGTRIAGWCGGGYTKLDCIAALFHPPSGLHAPGVTPGT